MKSEHHRSGGLQHEIFFFQKVYGMVPMCAPVCPGGVEGPLLRCRRPMAVVCTVVALVAILYGSYIHHVHANPHIYK